MTTTQRPSVAHRIERTADAYDYQLLVKHLLHSAPADAADQQIVFSELQRFDYRTLRQRTNRLAAGLASMGVKPGTTVAMLDWDSHRYLECFFAVPMMGAILHSLNVHLPPEQILYTMNDARDDVVLVNAEFLPLLEEIKDRLLTVKTFVLLTDGGDPHATSVPITAEYEDLLARNTPYYASATSTRTRRRRPTTQPARLECRRVSISAIVNWYSALWRAWRRWEPHR